MFGFIKNILFPTDFSDVANNAMNTAIAIAKRHSAKLHLFHVLIPQYISPVGNVQFGGIDFNDWQEMENKMNESIETLASSLSKLHEIEVTTHVNTGYVTEAIYKTAADLQVDLIVMGTHGMSGVREFFIGSNAYSTIKNAYCPVLTIPDSFKSTDFLKVLFPVRNIDGVDEKYHSINSILKANHSKVELLGIAEFYDFAAFDFVSEKVKELISKMKADNIEATYHNEFCDNIPDFILERAEVTKPDLLVINATIDNNWKRYFIGTYVQKIINHALCPVLSIKPPINKIELKAALNTNMKDYISIPEKLILSQVGI